MPGRRACVRACAGPGIRPDRAAPRRPGIPDPKPPILNPLQDNDVKLAHETTDPAPGSDNGIREAALRATRLLPPLWPLEASVAVNPYLGQVHEGFALAAARLDRAAGARLTMPRRWFAEQVACGRITGQDLSDALAGDPGPGPAPQEDRPLDALSRADPLPAALPTVADLVAACDGVDWPAHIETCIGRWAAAYFDRGQAIWPFAAGSSPWSAWRAWASHDRTPVLAGLPGFHHEVAALPAEPGPALAQAVLRMELPPAALEGYFHRLLMSLGGWAQLARRRQWQAERDGETDDSVVDFLAIRLVWDAALHRHRRDRIDAPWRAACDAYARYGEVGEEHRIDAVFQEAADRAAQRRLFSALLAPQSDGGPRPSPVPEWQAQAVFCIDVRSEPMRRALETVAPSVRTYGFAGFFGLTFAHRPWAAHERCDHGPVLVPPALISRCGRETDDARDERSARIRRRAARAWKRFSRAAVASFVHVEAVGLTQAWALLRGSVGSRARGVDTAAPAPAIEDDPGAAALADALAGALRAMGLTRDFAPLVLLVGHGAVVANNPHAATLQCGACGGQSGEVNTRLVASLLNRPDVRVELAARGLAIPARTAFVPAIHDTTSDELTIFDEDRVPADLRAALGELRRGLATASALARSRRAPSLPGAVQPHTLARRGADWSQPRPEWGLAGCQAMIVAPRDRTRGRSLDGRVFLHSYDHRRDDGYEVLEAILTAPVVVASWIALQYHGSCVAPRSFGAGNKLLHNAVGGVGVLEGNDGPLRAGLPWQSVSDGSGLVHEPVRLSVLIEAPREAIVAVLARHPEVGALFENRWLHLIVLDDEGRPAWRYAGRATWQPIVAERVQASVAGTA